MERFLFSTPHSVLSVFLMTRAFLGLLGTSLKAIRTLGEATTAGNVFYFCSLHKTRNYMG